jgi:hypothetical protein
VQINTVTYRIDENVVVLEGGLTLPLSETFTISGCEGATAAGLSNSRFGATFLVDAASVEVARAGCNGCG